MFIWQEFYSTELKVLKVNIWTKLQDRQSCPVNAKINGLRGQFHKEFRTSPTFGLVLGDIKNLSVVLN